MRKSLNYFEHFLAFCFSGCVSISAFALIISVSLGITSSVVGLKICEITARIKKYKSIIIKKTKKHDHAILLAKTKLNSIEFLIPKVLIDLYINHDEFFSVNDV